MRHSGQGGQDMAFSDNFSSPRCCFIGVGFGGVGHGVYGYFVTCLVYLSDRYEIEHTIHGDEVGGAQGTPWRDGKKKLQG